MRLILAAALTLTLAPPANAYCFCLKCVSGAWQSFQVASGSMKPTLEPNACAIVESDAEVARGDIIVFRHPVTPKDSYIYRLIGLPGDEIAMQNGQVILNGTALPQTPAPSYTQFMQPPAGLDDEPRCLAPTTSNEPCIIARFAETLPDGTSYDILKLYSFRLFDTMKTVTVPPGHAFALGDHRDVALDSRVSPSAMGMGLIEMENILGPVVEVTNP